MVNFCQVRYNQYLKEFDFYDIPSTTKTCSPDTKKTPEVYSRCLCDFYKIVKLPLYSFFSAWS
jgi:hypothetical protein